MLARRAPEPERSPPRGGGARLLRPSGSSPRHKVTAQGSDPALCTEAGGPRLVRPVPLPADHPPAPERRLPLHPRLQHDSARGGLLRRAEPLLGANGRRHGPSRLRLRARAQPQAWLDLQLAGCRLWSPAPGGLRWPRPLEPRRLSSRSGGARRVRRAPPWLRWRPHLRPPPRPPLPPPSHPPPHPPPPPPPPPP